ncbi:mechanosensitive ion channel family protein [Natronorubrum tibetense]|uniref:Small-conductance mechanosensitive channel n=1 Tax=Natronorubrum tibetense GA33 TaxID=1114856 RepID=L9VFN8_9EURY|nr:mechanosensitive ion channel domain-containing protein [Natronorubrum tibetense]ELY35884.1 small-conductance mechanosensitive channel [Natronorubrum tibetense GA33]
MTAPFAGAWSQVSAVQPTSLEPLTAIEFLLGWVGPALIDGALGRIDRAWLLVALILVASILLAQLVRLASVRFLDGELAETTFGRAAVAELHTPLAISIALLGVYLSLLVLDHLESTPTVVGLMATVLVVFWGRASIRIGRRWIEMLQEGETNYEFAPMFGNLWTITVVAGAVLLLLSIWNLDLTPFLASAGILGIVLGFAAQDAIGNLIGGVALYFDNTYKIGDVIRVDDDMRGTVTDVGIRSTTVLTEDNLLVTVPNAVLNSTEVVNESAPQRHMRLRVPITAAYGTDYETVERLVLEVCEECSLVRDTPTPKLIFKEFGDSALVFELRAYINHPLIEKRALDQINRGVYDAFDEADVTIPFPQRELSYLETESETRHSYDERVTADDPEVDHD